MRKTIVITGASDGIGAAAASQLNRDGHELVIVGRSPEKTAALARRLDVDHVVADFANLADVRDLAKTLLDRYPKIDVLANNAGGVFGRRELTVDGVELTFQVNHLAPFLLTNLLMPTLAASGATVVQTASVASLLYGHLDVSDLNNDRCYSADKAYGDSKLANILFTRELHRRNHDSGVSSAAFHPGFVGTAFAGETTSLRMRALYGNPLIKPFLKSADEGADQLVWLATSRPGTAWTSGSYYVSRRVARLVNRQVKDVTLARELWDASASLCGL